MKTFMTHDTQRKVADAPTRTKTKIFMTHDDAETPLTFCVRYALPDEWAAFAKTVKARVDKEPKEVFWQCNKCGYVITMRYREPSRQCIKCNFPGYENGGWLKEMTPGEVKKHLADKKIKNDEAQALAEKAGLYQCNLARQKNGQEPFTLEQFRAHNKAAMRAMFKNL